MEIKVTRNLTKALDSIRANMIEEAVHLIREIQDHTLSDSSLKSIRKMLSIAQSRATKCGNSDVSISIDALTRDIFREATIVSSTAHVVNAKGRKPVSLAYCILLMEHEKDVTCATVSNLLQQVSPEDKIFLLFNGFSDLPLRVHFEKHSGLFCYESESNLGVAGGRNFLYRKVVEFSGDVSHIVTLDNDVLLPNDLNTKTKEAVVEKYEKENIGVMGAVILDYKVEATRHFVEKNFLRFKGYLDADCYNIFSEDIRSYLNTYRGSHEKILWHVGMHPDFQRVYVHREDLETHQAGEKGFHPFLAHSPSIESLLDSDSFFVSNVPGCFQVFSLQHLHDVGYLEERFSPYFFEDSEFCIRSFKIGKSNITVPNLLLFHGTDGRHVERKQEDKRFAHIANEYRARYILFRCLGVSEPVSKLLSQARKVFRNERKKPSIGHEYASAVEGIRKGLNQYLNSSTEDRSLESAERLALNAEKSIGSPLVVAVNGRCTRDLEVRFDPKLPSKDESLPKLYFTALKRFRHVYRGQDCLIVCNGPSLQKTNLGLFRGIPTFSVNSSFVLQDQIDFSPDFYTAEDNHVVVDNIEQIRTLHAKYKFFPDKYRSMLGDEPNQFYLPTSWDSYFKSKASYEYPEFSEDIARVIFTGQTVTYLNLQLAYYFGFKRVFLVGLDFSYSIPKGARVDNNSIDHDEDDPNHFFPNYFGKGKQWHFPKLDSCLVSYSIAREKFEKAGREIIDLTAGGKLNVFPKMSVSSALGITEKVPQIGPGLELVQYIVDSAYALAPRFGMQTEYVQTWGQFFAVSTAKLVTLMSIESVSELSDGINQWIRSNRGESECIAYWPKGKLLLRASNLSFVQRLPFCRWIDSTLNSTYYESPHDVNESGSFTYDIPFFEAYSDQKFGSASLMNVLRDRSVNSILFASGGVFLKVEQTNSGS